MPTYKRFEDLPVWNSAIELGLKVFTLTDDSVFNYQGDLRSQLRRAALSVSNNIAEGFERGTTNELLMFLYIARGSAGEVRSMLCFAERMERIKKADAERTAANTKDLKSQTSNLKPQTSNLKSQISNLKSQIADLKTLAEACSRQLRAWADSLQNTDIKGQRHMTEATQNAFVHTKRAEAFMAKLQRMRVGADEAVEA